MCTINIRSFQQAIFYNKFVIQNFQIYCVSYIFVVMHDCIFAFVDSMFRSNMDAIKGRFASLLIEVESVLEANHVRVEDVRNFIIRTFCCSSDCMPKSNLSDIFNEASAQKIWSYEHYSPVDTLIRNLIPDHCSLMRQYKERFSGYFATIKLIEFIQENNFDQYDSDTDEMDVSTCSSEKMQYTRKHYRKLKVKLKIPHTKITQISMNYVQELWVSFADQFDIPSLTAIIDKILEGSLKIVWLILPHFAELIRTSAHKSDSVEFFPRHDITFVAIDDCVVYDEVSFIT